MAACTASVARWLALVLLSTMVLAEIPLYKQKGAPIDQRVSDLVSRMTLEEKVAQLRHPWTTTNNTEYLKTTFGKIGLGAAYTFWITDGQPCDMDCHAAVQNDLQTYFMNNTRLGIPISMVQETLHGGGGVIFPMPCGMGTTWNKDLLNQIGAVIGLEARANGVDRGFSPELNVVTDPRFGRTEENFGEDPQHVTLMGVNYLIGMQGNQDGPSSYLDDDHIAAEAKHFAAYAYGGKDAYAADISDQTLFDVYLRPWRFAARAGLRGLMASHNELNGVPMHMNYRMLTEIMREKFGFGEGLIASDYSDIGQLPNFRVTKNTSTAAIAAVTAGLDQDLGQVALPTLIESVQAGLVDVSYVDRAAGNVLREKFAAGLFDDYLLVNATRQKAVLNSPAHQQLALQAARESIVLLRNNFALPLTNATLRSLRQIAVLGPLAGGGTTQERDAARGAQLGGYTFGIAPDEAGINRTGLPISVKYARGSNVDDYDTSGIQAAVDLASASDFIFIVVGDSTDGYGAGSCGEGIDRDNLDVPGAALPLIDAVLTATAARKIPVVVILINGRPATFGEGALSSVGPNNALLQRIPGLLAAWRPGQLGGTALWDVITGVHNPSGRLAQTWARSVGQVRQFVPWYIKANTPTANYFDEPTSPLFPFGFGLSYSTYKVLSAKLSTPTVSATDVFSVTVTLASVGPTGQCVVQVYFQQQLSQYVRYNWMLLGFEKVFIPSDSKSFTTTLQLNAEDLGYYHTNSGEYEVEAGLFTIAVALDSSLAGAVSNVLQVV